MLFAALAVDASTTEKKKIAKSPETPARVRTRRAISATSLFAGLGHGRSPHRPLAALILATEARIAQGRAPLSVLGQPRRTLFRGSSTGTSPTPRQADAHHSGGPGTSPCSTAATQSRLRRRCSCASHPLLLLPPGAAGRLQRRDSEPTTSWDRRLRVGASSLTIRLSRGAPLLRCVDVSDSGGWELHLPARSCVTASATLV